MGHCVRFGSKHRALATLDQKQDPHLTHKGEAASEPTSFKLCKRQPKSETINSGAATCAKRCSSDIGKVATEAMSCAPRVQNRSNFEQPSGALSR